MNGSLLGGTLIAVAYFATSCVAFVAVGCDKAAANQRRRRIPEKRLHLLSFAGGWPGALLAHHVFRHKTQKRSFQVVFRLTIATNCLLLGCLLYALM